MAKGVRGSTPPQDAKPAKTSIVIEPAMLKKVRYISYKEGKGISKLVEEGLELLIKKFEKANGEITE